MASLTSRASVSSDSSSGNESSPLPLRPSGPRKGPPSEFVFIDYKGNRGRNDAGFTTQKSIMRAHVMRDYHRRQKHMKSERLKAGLKKLPKEKAPNEDASKVDPSVELYEPNMQKKGCCKDVPISMMCTSCKSNRLAAALFHASNSCSKISFKKALGHALVDPFSTGSVFMTKKMNENFTTLRTSTVIAAYPLNTFNMSVWWWQRALQAPALLYSLMYLCAGHRSSVQATTPGLAIVSRESAVDSVRYRSNSLQLLNAILNDPHRATNELSILVVAVHHNIEVLCSNHDAMEAHMSGLEMLIKMRGGLENMSHLVISKIIMTDTKAAAAFQRKPIFKMPDRWVKEIQQLQSINHIKDIPDDLQATATGFLKPSVMKFFDYNFLRHLERFRRIVIYYEMASRQPSMCKATDNDIFVVFEHDLAALPFDRGAFPTTEIQECVRLSLFIYSNIRFWKYASMPMLCDLAAHLMEALADAGFDYFLTAAPQLLLWVLIVGSVGSVGSAGHTWYLANMGRVSRHLKLSNWEDTKNVLATFYFVDFHVVDKSAKDTWDKAMLAT